MVLELELRQVEEVLERQLGLDLYELQVGNDDE